MGSGERGIQASAGGGRVARLASASALGAYLSASPALACPSCSLGQALETLVYVLGFMFIPYLIVTGVFFWMRNVVAQERDDSEQPRS